MRILKTTKPIPVWYLKSGADNYAYDQVKKVWLPGRTTPVSRADLSLMKKRGVRYDAPLSGQKPSASPPPSNTKGMWVAKKKPPAKANLVTPAGVPV